jgi:Uncharacterized protein conserved in bacteria
MRRASIGALFAAAFAAVPAAAQDVADFYDGKTVTVVSPSGVGGSIYAYALLVSNHIGRHIPGSPDAVIEARAGGGGVRAASWMTNAAPHDGTVIAELHPSSMVVPITRGMDEPTTTPARALSRLRRVRSYVARSGRDASKASRISSRSRACRASTARRLINVVVAHVGPNLSDPL